MKTGYNMLLNSNYAYALYVCNIFKVFVLDRKVSVFYKDIQLVLPYKNTK